MTATVFEVDSSLTTPDDFWRDPALREAADREYRTHRTGPWTSLPASVAYCPLAQLMAPDQLADIQSRALSTAEESGKQCHQILADLSCGHPKRGQIEYLFELGNWSAFFIPERDKQYGTMLQMLRYPFSRGSVHIQHKENGNRVTVDDMPVINPRYYLGSGEIDFVTMTAAQQFVDQVCATKPLADIVRKRVFPPIPDEEARDEVDEYDHFVRNYSTTNWHRKKSTTIVVLI